MVTFDLPTRNKGLSMGLCYARDFSYQALAPAFFLCNIENTGCRLVCKAKQIVHDLGYGGPSPSLHGYHALHKWGTFTTTSKFGCPCPRGTPSVHVHTVVMSSNVTMLVPVWNDRLAYTKHEWKADCLNVQASTYPDNAFMMSFFLFLSVASPLLVIDSSSHLVR